MSDVSITYAGIFHVKDDLWRFINTMEDHQRYLFLQLMVKTILKVFFVLKLLEFKNF